MLTSLARLVTAAALAAGLVTGVASVVPTPADRGPDASASASTDSTGRAGGPTLAASQEGFGWA